MSVHLKPLGLCQNREAKSYGFDVMPDGAVINDVVGGVPVVVIFDRGRNTAIPYFSRAAGRDLTFYAVEAEGDLLIEFKEAETGMRWNMLGHAMDGGNSKARASSRLRRTIRCGSPGTPTGRVHLDGTVRA